MDKSSERISFTQMAAEIEEGKILLPDFQRKFSWTDKEQQGRLAASVLCKMPIGSILLLDLPAREYAARRIGSNSPEDFIVLDSDETRQFLLDGQQRITVMLNTFSNLIHEKKGTRIDSLKRRSFLGIPKPFKKEKYERNNWGLRWLSFPLDNPEQDVPEFFTDEIKDTLFLEDFTKNTQKPFNPYRSFGSEELVAYCLMGKEYYLVPLYLLVQRKEKNIRSKNKKLLENILNAIALGQANHLLEEYGSLHTSGEQISWLTNLLREEAQVREVLEDYEKLEDKLTVLQETWAEDMRDYLYSCMEDMSLHIMGVPNSSREKAIEVFENMNRGGIKLSAFDLVMARAARSNRNFTQDLEKECRMDRTYAEENVPERLRTYCQKYIKMKRAEEGRYNALLDTGCMNEKGDYAKLFQDSFLNILSLQCAKSKGQEYSYREEMRREKILGLSAEEINENYRICCEALDRAAFFLKARCGIRSIQEVNYQLMYTVLAYLFLEKAVFDSNGAWNLLTAWYWCVIFAGGYDKDQNTQAVRDIVHLSSILREKKDIAGYIDALFEKAWNAFDFSDKDFLLYRKSAATENYPKEVLGNYICQFYLAEGYSDMFEENVQLCTFPANEMEAQLEKHHIIPVKSFQTLKESEKWLKTDRGKRNIVNSPLNVAFVTRTANKKIASCNFSTYVKYLRPEISSALDLPPDIPEFAHMDIEKILSFRFTAMQSRLAARKREWMAQWQ